MNRTYVGMEGEDAASSYLTGLGARILGRNVCLAGAELDIIALMEGVCVFVEVKRRLSSRFGTPAEAVTPSKQKRILRAAALYLSMRGLSDRPVRFDVIELMPGTLRHIRGAFDATVR